MVVDWDRRYREGFYDGAVEPHETLTKFWQKIPGRYVADIAMGNGRDAMFLAEKGFFVTGLERSTEAISIAKKSMESGGACVWPVLGDAKHLPFRKNSLDGVVVFYFLIRDIMGELSALLKKDGILIYETFLKRQNDIDRQRNQEYLLDDGELIGYFDNFELLFYEETIESAGGKRRARARAVGRKT
jgi:ubiquinone/menaquinone biosynthesis C-methylase UbiE